MPKKFTLQDFIDRANLVHNFLYDYSKVEYKNYEIKVTVICKIHGEFNVSPHHHIGSKTTCQKCGVAKRASSHLHDKETFVKKANKVHNYRYDYSDVIYKNTETKVSINCDIHGIFKQTPHSHLSGQGCSKCTRGGAWRRNEWLKVCSKTSCTPIVYIIRCFNQNENFIKIGRTKNSIKFRFRCHSILPYSYEIIKEIKGSPDFIYDKEKELHKLFKDFKYKPLLGFAGKYECFNISILEKL